MTILTREEPIDLVVRPMRPRTPTRRRPNYDRPAGAALGYRRPAVLMSRASHRPRPVTPVTTVVLALIAAAITVWLGLVANLGASAETPKPVPGQLAVVQVQMGESLPQLAQRVNPDAPVATVVDQIRDLNELNSASVDAGRTLIAPVA